MIFSIYLSNNHTQFQLAQYSPKYITCCIMGARQNKSLAYLRKVRCSEMVVRSTKGILPEYLPLTEDSARQHSLRVYWQIMLWKDINSSIEPTDWGWRQDDSCLVPVMSTQVFKLTVFFSKKAILTIGVDSIFGRCLLISI